MNVVQSKVVKRFIIWTISILVTIVVIAAVAIPFAVPPLATRIVTSKLLQLGIPADLDFHLGYCWTSAGPGLRGKCKLSLPNTPWTVKADFGASVGNWHATVKMPETAFDEQDPALKKLLREHPVNAVSNIAFSGKIALDASVRRTWSFPVPVWEAKARLSDLNASCLSADKPVSVSGFGLTAGVSGIDRHIDIAPMFPRAANLTYAELSLTNFHAVVRATEKALMINEATAGFCGGQVTLYSLFLDPATLNTGFTLFLEDVDTGRILSSFPKVRGTASGHLHGKIKLFVREGGGEIRLRDAFLYSVPGETGKLRLEDSSAVTDSLALAGLDDDKRENVARALADLDYTVLRLNLKRVAGNEATLGIQVEGNATRGSVSAPVVLNINFHGDLEQLINTGLKVTGSGKDKTK